MNNFASIYIFFTSVFDILAKDSKAHRQQFHRKKIQYILQEKSPIKNKENVIFIYLIRNWMVLKQYENLR